jgi:hypothetical protein
VFTSSRDRSLDPPPTIAIAGVRVAGVVSERADVWSPIARLARGLAATVRASEITPSSHALWRNRYLDESVSPVFQRLAQGGKPQAITRGLLPVLTAIERVLPLPAVARTVVGRERPDVLVVLSAPDAIAAVNTSPAQIDLIAAAKRCGVPTVACVGGADIPVNPWLLHARPDLAVVWNDLQKKYVTRQNGSARVAVVGASPLDGCVDESARAPFDRAEFFESLGLPKRRPYVLVHGSTGLMAPVAEEIRFVQRFIRHMRRGTDRELRRTAVLIRPAPGHAEAWAAADFTGLGHVVVSPTAYEATGATDYALLPESIRYAGAVVSSHAFALTVAVAMQRPAIGITPRGRAIEALAGAGVKWVQDPASAYAALRAAVGNAMSAETYGQFMRQRLRPNGALLPASQHLTAVIDEAVSTGRRWRERPSLLAILSWPLLLCCSGAVVAVESAGAGLSSTRAWLRRRRRAAKRPVDPVSIEPDIDVPRGGAVSAG